MRAPQADRQAAVPCFALRLPCHGFPQLPSRSSCSHHTPYKGAGSFPPLFASAFLGFKLPVSAIFQFSLPHLGTPDVTTNVATTPTQQQALAVFLRPGEWPFELTISFLFFSPIPLISGGRIRAGSGELESCCGVEARGRGMTPCGDSIACEVCVEGVGSVLAQVAVGGALGWWDFWSEPGSGLWLLLPARVEWKRRRRLRSEEFSGALTGVTGVERGGGLCSWQRSGSGAVEGQHRHFLAPCEGERRELRWQRSCWTSRSPLMSAFLMPPWQHSMALAPKKR